MNQKQRIWKALGLAGLFFFLLLYPAMKSVKEKARQETLRLPESPIPAQPRFGGEVYQRQLVVPSTLTTASTNISVSTTPITLASVRKVAPD